MHVLLINPYLISSCHVNYTCEPLGLISLATFAQTKTNWSVSILDLYSLNQGRRTQQEDQFVFGLSDPKRIHDLIKNSFADVVGISCNFTSSAQAAFDIASISAQALPDAQIIMGGTHVSLDAKNTLQQNCDVDFIVIGEGELTFVELLLAIEQQKDFKKVDGLALRDKEQVIVTAPRQLIRNLDILPIPDRGYIDIEFYKKINKKVFQFSYNNPNLTMMASRGCPFNCVFCSTKVMWTNKWRTFSPNRILEEMLYLKEQFGVKEITFNDDQFIGNKNHLSKLCDLLIRHKLELTFFVSNGVSIWLLDIDLLKKMKRAGFYRLGLPIETGKEKTMKYIKKPVDIHSIYPIVEAAHKEGFWTYANIIIGFPFETKKDIFDTIDFVCSSPLDFTIFLVAQPLEGTEMYRHFKDTGLLKTRKRCGSFYFHMFDTTHLKASEIQALQQKATIQFIKKRALTYTQPQYLRKNVLPKIKSFRDVLYFMKMGFQLVRMFIIPRFLYWTGSGVYRQKK